MKQKETQLVLDSAAGHFEKKREQIWSLQDPLGTWERKANH